ncbi:unnamed protein product [Ophioblennius macclurei]
MAALRCLGAEYRGSRTSGTYYHGQSPEPNIREYFYYLDRHGQLFLDDTKMKNFLTRLRDKRFLVFFFNRLRLNYSGRYEEDFPYIALCGGERNFLRCEDRPVVFTHLMQEADGDREQLSYCGGAEKLAVLFEPEKLYIHPETWRVYHPCSVQHGGVGLISSPLAIELIPFFIYGSEQGQPRQPTHFVWYEHEHTLTNELAGRLTSAQDGRQ